ncbi:hypothetical protein AT730_25670 (plasmid) [Vibrio alginolyticus]|nr:hypothetical protein AT730_25670 [Vibrio alginolyticus]
MRQLAPSSPSEMKALHVKAETRPNLIYQFKQGDSFEVIWAQLGIKHANLAVSMKRHLNEIGMTIDAPGASLAMWNAENSAYRRLRWCNMQMCWDINLHTREPSFQSVVTLHSLRHSIPLRTPWNLSERLSTGDRIEMVVSPSLGEQDIIAFRVHHSSFVNSAYRHQDGHLYSRDGTRIVQTLSQHPVSADWQISSSFNLHRVHPVTGLVRPHYGTDFAVPKGTPVFTTGDGVVRVARYSMSAGNYIEIKHDAHYTTKYFHLSRLMVKEGQHVKQGQIIGRSGQTGMSSGAHLHYELLKDGKHIDAMLTTANVVAALPMSQRRQFQALYHRKKW